MITNINFKQRKLQTASCKQQTAAIEQHSTHHHSTAMVSLSMKRVVSVFILRPNEGPPTVQQPQPQPQNDDYRVALFRRCATMPTFPGRWAGISGSIEDDDGNPLEAALRELREETNLSELLFSICKNDSGGSGGGGTAVGDASRLLRDCIQQGLHVDVVPSSDRSDGTFGGRIIRVYPFALTLPSSRCLSSVAGEDDGPADTSERTGGSSVATLWSNLEMKGTEHDALKFLKIEEFLDMAEPCVPALKLAFHHATHGSYLNVRDCASSLTLFVQHAFCSNYSENLC